MKAIYTHCESEMALLSAYHACKTVESIQQQISDDVQIVATLQTKISGDALAGVFNNEDMQNLVNAKSRASMNQEKLVTYKTDLIAIKTKVLSDVFKADIQATIDSI